MRGRNATNAEKWDGVTRSFLEPTASTLTFSPAENFRGPQLIFHIRMELDMG